MKYKLGFSLVELMAVIVIIGVMTAVALPNYQRYLVRSKFSEAYRIIGDLVKKEATYYYENKEFYNVGPNPASLDIPMTVVANANWATIGYPAIIGENLFFTYRAVAGKIDGSGSEVATSVETGRGFSTRADNSIFEASYTSPAATCNSSLSSPGAMGALNQTSYDWVVITAVGDLRQNRDSQCTAIGLLVETVTGGSPGSPGGIILLNPGE